MNLDFLSQLGLEAKNPGTWTGQENSSQGAYIESYSPVDGKLIGAVSTTTREEYDAVIEKATEAFKVWRKMPAPKRGEIVRQYQAAE